MVKEQYEIDQDMHSKLDVLKDRIEKYGDRYELEHVELIDWAIDLYDRYSDAIYAKDMAEETIIEQERYIEDNTIDFRAGRMSDYYADRL